MDFVRSRKKIYGAYLLGAPFIVITLYALQAWVPTLLIRVHGMDIADAGRGYGSIALLCGSAGVLSGPVLAQYFTRKGHKDAGLRVATLAAAVLLPAIVFAGFTAIPLWHWWPSPSPVFCHRADGAFYNRFAGSHPKRDARRDCRYLCGDREFIRAGIGSDIRRAGYRLRIR